MSARDQLEGYIEGAAAVLGSEAPERGSRFEGHLRSLVDHTVREAVLAAQEPHVWTDVIGSMVCTVCFKRRGEGVHAGEA